VRAKLEMKSRTQKQLAAMRCAFKLLEGQFDDLLIVCAMRADYENPGTDPDVYWKGCYLAVNGMADFAKHRIGYQRRATSKPK